MHQHRNHPRNVSARRRKAQIMKAKPVSMAAIYNQVQGLIKKHNGSNYFTISCEMSNNHGNGITHNWRLYVHNWGGHYGPTAPDALQALRTYLEGGAVPILPADVTLDF